MNFLRNFTLLLFLSIFTLTQSCVKQPCSEIPCHNGEDCINGACDCMDWTSGEFCQVEIRSRYYGRHYGTTTWFGHLEETEINFTQDGANLQRILVDDSYYLELATVSEFFVPKQEINIQGVSTTIQGDGILYSNRKIEYNYTLTSNGITTAYTFKGSY